MKVTTLDRGLQVKRGRAARKAMQRLCCPLPDSALVRVAILGKIPNGPRQVVSPMGWGSERVCRTGEPVFAKD
jgi:hypothetical protein